MSSTCSTTRSPDCILKRAGQRYILHRTFCAEPRCSQAHRIVASDGFPVVCGLHLATSQDKNSIQDAGPLAKYLGHPHYLHPQLPRSPITTQRPFLPPFAHLLTTLSSGHGLHSEAAVARQPPSLRRSVKTEKIAMARPTRSTHGSPLRLGCSRGLV